MTKLTPFNVEIPDAYKVTYDKALTIIGANGYWEGDVGQWALGFLDAAITQAPSDALTTPGNMLIMSMGVPSNKAKDHFAAYSALYNLQEDKFIDGLKARPTSDPQTDNLKYILLYENVIQVGSFLNMVRSVAAGSEAIQVRMK